MTDAGRTRLTAADVLRRYQDEDLPEFVERQLTDVNQVGNFGNYPIHVAAVRGAIDELEALIAGGADVNVVGELGNTPLHEAVDQNQVEAVRLLLAHGASPNVKNEWGSTPLDIARMHGREDVVALLT
jgi:ankyrin repeat protein